MPALAPINQCIKVSFKWTIGGDPGATTITHWGTSASPVSASDLAAMASHINATAVSQWPGVMSAQVTLTEVIVQDMSSNTGAIGTSSTTLTGGLTGGETTGALCVLINHQVQTHYRGGHGRCYMPWGNGSVLATPQTWTSAFQTLCSSAWSSMKSQTIGYAAPGGVSITQFGVASYWSGGTWHQKPNGNYIRVPTPKNPPVLMPSSTSSVSLTPGTQRRRLRPG
jgi:hypothetical protein